MSETISFRVREYECDAYGHVNAANYLRFAREAARRAAPRLLAELDLVMLEHLAPLRPDSSFTVVTHLDRASALEQEFLAAGGSVASRARWNRLASDSSDATRYPPEPPVAPQPFEIYRRVEWRDVGVDERVHPANLLSLMEDAGVAVLCAHGWPPRRNTGAGFAIFLRRHHLHFQTAVELGALLRCRTWVSNMSRAGCVRYYRVDEVTTGYIVAESHAHYAWIDLVRMRPMRAPEQFTRDFDQNIVRANRAESSG